MGSSEQPNEPNSPNPVAIADTSFLAGLPEDSIERLRDLAKPVHLAAGEWLFHEGDQADCAYVVRTGRVEVLSHDRIIRTARPGGRYR